MVEELCYKRKVAGSSPYEVIELFSIFLILPAPLDPELTLTEMSTRMSFWDKERPARKADNLTAIYEQIVWTMWDP
jgi:hypothetical protein